MITTGAGTRSPARGPQPVDRRRRGCQLLGAVLAADVISIPILWVASPFPTFVSDAAVVAVMLMLVAALGCAILATVLLHPLRTSWRYVSPLVALVQVGIAYIAVALVIWALNPHSLDLTP